MIEVRSFGGRSEYNFALAAQRATGGNGKRAAEKSDGLIDLRVESDDDCKPRLRCWITVFAEGLRIDSGCPKQADSSGPPMKE